MSLDDIECVAIDFETTGTVEGFPSEPWQIGMVRISGGAVQCDSCFESLLRVGDRPFSPKAPGVHHLLREKLSEAPTLHDLWPKLQGWWYGAPLVAHNVSTEKTIITKTAPLHVPGPWIDTLKLARIAYPTMTKHGLSDLLEELDLMSQVVRLCPGRLPHDALFDAVGCGILLIHLLTLDGWKGVRLDDLTSAHPQAFYKRRGGKK